MGVSGTGKSSVAERLARRLGVDFIEGDDLHPAANREKMAAGIPLTDEDRWPWLAKILERMREESARGRGLVVTCSALRRAYREVISGDDAADTVFAHLSGPKELIAARLENRKGHFFPKQLLDSQFETLEPLEAGENGFEVGLEGTVAQEVQEILDGLAARETRR